MNTVDIDSTEDVYIQNIHAKLFDGTNVEEVNKFLSKFYFSSSTGDKRQYYVIQDPLSVEGNSTKTPSFIMLTPWDWSTLMPNTYIIIQPNRDNYNIFTLGKEFFEKNHTPFDTDCCIYKA